MVGRIQKQSLQIPALGVPPHLSVIQSNASVDIAMKGFCRGAIKVPSQVWNQDAAGWPDLIRWALKRARALPGERNSELVREKLSSGGFGDGEGMWVALRTSHFLCCKSCPLVRGDGIAFGSTVKDKAFCNSTDDPGRRTSGREDKQNMYLLHENQALLPPRWTGPQWPPSNLSVSLALWCKIQETATCLSWKDAPDHRNLDTTPVWWVPYPWDTFKHPHKGL